MKLRRLAPGLPTGLSFDIPDLLMLQAWADFHGLRLAIDLDVCSGGDEYEELVGLSHQGRAFRRWLIWRSADGIAVQSLGRTMMFNFMADALERLIPSRD